MSGPYTGVCTPWADASDLCSPCDDYAFSATVLDDALDVASDILFELSGRRWPGICCDVVRPCSQCVAEEHLGSDLLFHAACGCSSGRRCGCSRLPQIGLGVFPLISVDQVRIDGDVLDSTRYRVDDYRWLIRLPDADGTNPGWPLSQRVDLASDQDDTFEVNFTYGAMPPVAGVRAAAVLACELALACSPETVGRCQLNKRVQSVVRQGVTVVLDRMDAFEKGLTGISEVDLFLTTYNPGRLRRRARIISPDGRPKVRRVAT